MRHNLWEILVKKKDYFPNYNITSNAVTSNVYAKQLGPQVIFLKYFYFILKIVFHYILLNITKSIVHSLLDKKHTKSTDLTRVLNCFVLYISVFWGNCIWGNVIIGYFRGYILFSEIFSNNNSRRNISRSYYFFSVVLDQHIKVNQDLE